MARRGAKSTTLVRDLRAEIEAALDEKFVDRSAPRFDFVRGAHVAPGLLGALIDLGGERLTDLNTDFGERLVFSSAPPGSVTLRISFVGPFASATRTDAKGTTFLERGDDRVLVALQDVLRRYAYVFVPRFVLESTTRLRLENAFADGTTTLFNALFEDTDRLPWAE